jgi:hypothetical protein
MQDTAQWATTEKIHPSGVPGGNKSHAEENVDENVCQSLLSPQGHLRKQNCKEIQMEAGTPH